jgi:hypothetical protein
MECRSIYGESQARQRSIGIGLPALAMAELA